jgi:hypothetical protein
VSGIKRPFGSIFDMSIPPAYSWIYNDPGSNSRVDRDRGDNIPEASSATRGAGIGPPARLSRRSRAAEESPRPSGHPHTSERRTHVLPLHPQAPNGGTAPTTGRGRVRALVLTGLSMVILAAVVGPTTDLLVLAVIALGAAAVLGRRARRAAAAATPARSVIATGGLSPADTEAVTPDFLTERLRALYDDHVEKLNLALEEGREDLAREVSDSYMDESLSLITGGGPHPRYEFPVR